MSFRIQSGPCRRHHDEFDANPQKFAARHKLDIPALIRKLNEFYQEKLGLMPIIEACKSVEELLYRYKAHRRECRTCGPIQIPQRPSRKAA